MSEREVWRSSNMEDLGSLMFIWCTRHLDDDDVRREYLRIFFEQSPFDLDFVEQADKAIRRSFRQGVELAFAQVVDTLGSATAHQAASLQLTLTASRLHKRRVRSSETLERRRRDRSWVEMAFRPFFRDLPPGPWNHWKQRQNLPFSESMRRYDFDAVDL